jgi:hypothetical protein
LKAVFRKYLRKKARWLGYVARAGEIRNAYTILVGKTEIKRAVGRPRRRWMIFEWILGK